MSELPGATPALVFRARPKAVPGDLRISWRLSMTLLALYYSRGRQASFIKLHILNGALRFSAARERLVDLLNGVRDIETCTIRIEPAFSRNLDLLVGKGLAEWLGGKKLSVRMTPKGVAVAEEIEANEDLFRDEKEFLETIGRRVKEQTVKSLISVGKGWQV